MALLDTYSGTVLAARSFKRLYNAYSGDCCQIYLGTAGTTHQIGFTAGGDFDMATYLSVAGSETDVYMTAFYDQSGNGEHWLASFPFTTYAPKLRTGGVDNLNSFGQLRAEFVTTSFFSNTGGLGSTEGARTILWTFELNSDSIVSGSTDRPRFYSWAEGSLSGSIWIQGQGNISPMRIGAYVRSPITGTSFISFSESLWSIGDPYTMMFRWDATKLNRVGKLNETVNDLTSQSFSLSNVTIERTGWTSTTRDAQYHLYEHIVYGENRADADTISAETRAYWDPIIVDLTTTNITTSQQSVGSPSVNQNVQATANSVTNSPAVVSDADVSIIATIGTLGAINNKGIVSNADVATGAEAGTRVGLAQFKSLLGRNWSIEIHDNTAIFQVSTPNFEVRSDGFTLNYESPNDGYLDIIKGSKVAFTMIIGQNDTLLQTLIEDIGGANDGRFFVRIYEDTDLYWFGQIQTSLIREPDTWPSQVKITAVDGLALLKDIQYQPSGNVSDGIPINRGRFTEIIAECLSEIGAYNTFFSGSDTPVKYAVDWYHSDMASLNNCPMFTSGVRRFLFKQENTEADIGYEPISCYEVLEIILKAWNARIILTNGQFLVEQSATHINTLRREWDLTVDGSTSGTVASENNTRTIDQTNVIRLAGGSRSWQKALKSVTKTGVHNTYDNILQQQINYETLTDFNPESLPLSIGSNDAKTLKIRIPIQLTIFNRTGSPYNLQGNYVALAMTIKLQGPTDTIYLQKSLFADVNTATWDTSSDFWFISMELTGPISDGQFVTVEKIVEFETPVFTNDDYNVQEIRIQFPVASQLYSSANTSSVYSVSALNFISVSDNQYDPTYSGDLLMWYTTGFSTIQLNGGSEQPSNEIEFTVSDSTSTAIETYDYGDIKIGTVFRSSVELSAINVYDGSAWTIPGAGWDQGGLTGTYKFNVLGSRELLDLRNTTRSRQNFTIQGTINANNSIAYNSDKYVFMGGQFVANLDRWSGEWLEIPSTSSLTGFTSVEDVLGIPGTLNVGSTVSNVDELAGQVAGVLQSGSITGVSSGIAQGTVITGIDIEDFAQNAVITANDVITVISAATGQYQNFTVTSDVNSGDTTISVASETTEFEIQEGDVVTISTTQLAKNSNSFSEEGTFTPSCSLASGTVTVLPSGTNGFYNVIGDLVFVRLRVTVDSVSSPFGDVFITNLPYNGDGTTNSFQSTIFNTISGDYVWGGFLVGNTIELYGLNTSQQASQDLQNATVITISGFYKKA